MWARRGEGLLPPAPEKFDDRVLRVEMTDHPTRLFVVGDRNIYVKLDLPLMPDWNRAWEEVFDVDLLMQDLFDYETDPWTGQQYNAIPGDTENAQGYQLAAARAREITVREYAELRARRPAEAGGPKDFSDFRLFGGRSRMDLPAAIYIDQLLFRAFRPPPTVNLGGGQVPTEALEIVEDLPARITHDPVSGLMTAHLDNVSGGNGYLITRGFRIGQELFLVLQPERFDVDLFLKSTELWGALTFQIDDSGETGRFIIMDEKVVKTANLIAWAKSDGDWLNGYAVLNANPKFEIPEVRAALVFAGDRFYAPMSKGALSASGTGQRNNGRDGVVCESGLYRECIVHSSKMGTRLTEIPYADGELAWLKAMQIATPLLARPTWYWTGSQRWILRAGDQIPDLTGMIDRITLQQSDTGHECVMEFGGERVPRTKMLERDYDRLSRMRTVIPRQQELLNEARMLREIAAVFRTNPDIARRMMQETQRVLGANPMEGYARITIRGGNGRFAAGTPLRKAAKQTAKDAETGAFKSSNTWAVMPADATAAENQFVGVTVRNGENAAGNLRVQASGVALARVQGPVVAGDNLVLPKADGEHRDYLVKEDKGDAGAMAVGRALEGVSDGPTVNSGEPKLIKVWLGVGAGGKGGGYGVWA